MFTNEPGYFTGFVLELLPFRCYVELAISKQVCFVEFSTNLPKTTKPIRKTSVRISGVLQYFKVSVLAESQEEKQMLTSLRETSDSVFLISSFRRVLYVVCFLLGNYPASEVHMATFRNTLSVPSS